MRLTKYFASFLLMIVCLIAKPTNSNAQCGTPISTFPYNEGFEANNGGWITGGNAPDWAWGTPTKPVIHSAANGAKCWITGGLSTSSYNNSENSWLQSPCFDISSLTKPQLSFSIFWETENKFDGASIQYSLDGGVSWTNLGGINDDPCTTANWFNNASINFLGNSNGWSGNIQSNSGSCQGGNGSGAWLTARHDLSFLGAATTVSFRFRFGAGTTCNAFDGFAIDDIKIEEAPPGSADFSFNCGPATSISFFKNTTGCAISYAWNFGEASSATNTSALPNPAHVYNIGGNYTVTMIATFSQGPPIMVTHVVNVIDVSISIVNNLKCSRDVNGALTANVNGGPGIYNYIWSTAPTQQTASINNLSAGMYTVAVSGNNACLTTATITLTDPPAIVNQLNITQAFCGNNKGSATANVSGGTAPYSYLWSTAATSNTINNLAPANYNVLVRDANNCSLSTNFTVQNINKQVPVFLGNDTVLCPGSQIILSPGVYASYKWTDNSTGPILTVTGPGTYGVMVTDADGCMGSDDIGIVANCLDINFPTAFTPDKNGLNDSFGALGNTASLRHFSLRVYDRYGEVVFSTTDPAVRWDGRIKSSAFNSGSFVWIASFNQNGGALQNRHGIVTIIK